MRVVSWQDAGFPDVRNVDYAKPMFTLINAVAEYKYYAQLYRYPDVVTDWQQFMDSEEVKRICAGKYYNSLDPWNYFWSNYRITRDRLSPGLGDWNMHYLWSIRASGSFDYVYSDGSMESVMRSLSGTPSGALLTARQWFAYSFPAEQARQLYMTLSGYMCSYCIGLHEEVDLDRGQWRIYIPQEHIDRMSSYFSSLVFCVGYANRSFTDLGTVRTYGAISEGTSVVFDDVPYDHDYFAFCRGIPRGAVWIGQRIGGLQAA